MGQYTRDPLTHDPLTDAIKFHEQFQWLSVFDLKHFLCVVSLVAFARVNFYY